MKYLGLIGAALAGGVVVAGAAAVTGVIEMPYTLELRAKAPAAVDGGVAPPADSTDMDEYDQVAEEGATEPDEAPAPEPVAEALPPLPRERPVYTAQSSSKPRPQPVSERPRASRPTGNVDYFFDELAPYGRWVENDDYGYVFVPKRRGAGWRPFQEGRWTWTDDYGWYWESSEPFGWATYHYGRWDYDPDYGWYWVPGDTWSPAWATFRVGGGQVGWAPIAPDRPGYAYGQPRRYDPPVSESWVFVDERYFDEDDVGRRAAPVRDIGRYLGEARDERRPRFEDGRYYNEPIGRRDRPGREIVYVDEQNDIFDDDRGGRIGVFRPRIEGERFDRRPDRFDRDVPRDDRTLIHQYVEPDPKAAIAGVVSAALLSVLNPGERQELRRDRDRDQPQQRDRMQAEIDKLRTEKAALVDEQRKQSEARAADIDAANKKAAAERQSEQERVRKERAARADEVLKKVEANPQPAERPTPEQGGQPAERPQRPEGVEGGRPEGGRPERPQRPARQEQPAPAEQPAVAPPEAKPETPPVRPEEPPAKAEEPRRERPARPAEQAPPPVERPAVEPQPEQAAPEAQPEPPRRNRPAEPAEEAAPRQEQPAAEPEAEQPRRPSPEAEQPAAPESPEAAQPRRQRPERQRDAEPRQPEQEQQRPQPEEQPPQRRERAPQAEEPQAPAEEAQPQRRQRQEQREAPSPEQMQREEPPQREEEGRPERRQRPERGGPECPEGAQQPDGSCAQ